MDERCCKKAAPWSEASVKGCKRFIDRTYGLQELLTDKDATEYSAELSSSFHKTIKKVTEDIEGMKFNTAIAALMTLINQVYDNKAINGAELKTFLQLLNPFAPHVCEEVWEAQGWKAEAAANGAEAEGLLALIAWPTYDEAKCVDETIEIAVQVSGKIKNRINVPADIDEAGALELAKADEKVAAALEGKTIIKELYVKGRLVNIVAK